MSYDISSKPVQARSAGPVEIVREFPPNIEQIRAAGLGTTGGTIFTYGKVIYAPEGLDPGNKPLIAHEKVHMKQQGDRVEHWWGRYLVDPGFRLWQEIPAYHRQYQIAKRGLTRNQRATYLEIVAGFLAGPLYGNIVSLSKAKHLVSHGHV